MSYPHVSVGLRAAAGAVVSLEGGGCFCACDFGVGGMPMGTRQRYMDVCCLWGSWLRLKIIFQWKITD